MLDVEVQEWLDHALTTVPRESHVEAGCVALADMSRRRGVERRVVASKRNLAEQMHATPKLAGEALGALVGGKLLRPSGPADTYDLVGGAL